MSERISLCTLLVKSAMAPSDRPGGEASYGEDAGNVMQLIADDVQSVVIPRTATGSPRTSVSRTHPG